jgi:hypothetical protein
MGWASAVCDLPAPSVGPDPCADLRIRRSAVHPLPSVAFRRSTPVNCGAENASTPARRNWRRPPPGLPGFCRFEFAQAPTLDETRATVIPLPPSPPAITHDQGFRMRMNRTFTSRLLTLTALGVLASPAIAGGCGGDSNLMPAKKSLGGTSGSGGSSAGRGGMSGSASGGTGGNGAQGGTMVDGGEAGESTGGTGGSGDAMAGRGGQATGGAGAGGSAGMSGGGAGSSPGGAGQSGGSAGQSGAAGNGTAGMVGVLGTPCSPPGALACAGNHQKLTVLCGGDGEWEPNQTCGNDQYCDSTPGQNVGTCQPVAEGCEAGPGIVSCSTDEKRIITCGPDAVTKGEETCQGACHRGVCRDDREACPDWDQYDYGVPCAKDCGEPDSPSPVGGCVSSDEGCITSLYSTLSTVVRSPWSDDVCACELTEGRTLRFFHQSMSGNRRITVPQPWSIGSCGEEPRHCIVLNYSADYVNLWTPALDSGPVNILVEEVDSGETCPE